MGKLEETMMAPAKRRQVVDDCCRMIDEEVDAKGGLTGLAIKAAYKTVKAVKSDFVPRAVEGLLPDFVRKLEPFWEERQAKAPGQPMATYLPARAGAVADALLSVTDARAEKADRGAVRSAYEKLRPTGKRNVEEAMPRIGRLLDKHVQ